MRRLVIGTRGSELALWQTNHIADRLRALVPGIEVEIEIISTKGDRIRDVPLAKIGGKGLFTQELEAALLDRRADLAVHSLKDVPTEFPAGLMLAAIPERENPCDALVTADGCGIDALPSRARVGTSSLRRKVQLLARRPDLQIVDLRGNVPTRLRKLHDEGLDAIVLATAGLKRLGLDGHISQILDHTIMLPAVGQGALGIEARSDDAVVLDILAALSDPDTVAATTAERSLLAGMGGGCQVPIGALARVEEGVLVLHACVCSLDGKTVIRCRVEGALSDAEAIGLDAAKRLRAEGGDAIVASALAAETGSLSPQERGGVREGLNPPLAGKRIIVTRAADQARDLVGALEAEGAEVISFPVIETCAVPCEDIGPASDYDWAVFTSTNAVRYFAQALSRAGQDIATFRACSICAVGPATRKALLAHGLPVSLTPEESLGTAVRDAMVAIEGGVAGKRILFPRGNLVPPMLADALREAGARVSDPVVYETRTRQVESEAVEALAAQQPDLVAFTSGSTVRGFIEALGADRFAALGIGVASIGPVTTATARELGLEVTIEAREYDIPGLVRAIVAHYA